MVHSLTHSFVRSLTRSRSRRYPTEHSAEVHAKRSLHCQLVRAGHDAMRFTSSLSVAATRTSNTIPDVLSKVRHQSNANTVAVCTLGHQILLLTCLLCAATFVVLHFTHCLTAHPCAVRVPVHVHYKSPEHRHGLGRC